MSTHQPSSEVFALFSYLLMLSRGEMIFGKASGALRLTRPLATLTPFTMRSHVLAHASLSSTTLISCLHVPRSSKHSAGSCARRSTCLEMPCLELGPLPPITSLPISTTAHYM